MSQFASNYPAGADRDPNAPWNQVGQPEQPFKGEKTVRYDGIDYFVTGDGMGNYTVCFADCERNRDLKGYVPQELYDTIIEKTNEL